MAGGYRDRSERFDVQAFFFRMGARYKRIRKRPRGIPSPQLYDYKYKKPKEPEPPERKGCIALYYADESHICSEGYVPYDWLLPGKQVCIPIPRIRTLRKRSGEC
jgi:hypothetical protein